MALGSVQEQEFLQEYRNMDREQQQQIICGKLYIH
jgi:hypothetical protein